MKKITSILAIGTILLGAFSPTIQGIAETTQNSDETNIVHSSSEEEKSSIQEKVTGKSLLPQEAPLLKASFLDSWMPDKALQKAFAQAIGAKKVEDISNMTLEEISSTYINSSYNFIEISMDVKSLKGIDTFVKYIRENTDYSDAFFAVNLYVPNNFNQILDYLNTIDYQTFGEIVENYGTDYTEGTINQPGISVSLGNEENIDYELSETLSSSEIVQLVRTLWNKLGKTQINNYTVNMNTVLNLTNDNYHDIFLSPENLGISDLSSIITGPESKTRVEGSDSLRFIAEDNEILNYTAKEEVSGDIRPILYSLQAPTDFENLSGKQFTLSEEGELGYRYMNSDTVSLPQINIVPTLNFLKKAGNITAKYVDTEGNMISDNVVKTGNIGEVYNTEQKDIDGYTFKEVQGNTTGQFTDQPQTVTYVYTKNELPNVTGTVFVKYVDTDRNKISEDVIKSGIVGEGYSTEKKDIKGYTFKEIQGNITGQFTNQVQTVTYVYAKNKVNTVNPEPKPENKPSSKDKNNNQGITSSEQHGLPATGENERMTMMSIILGLILLALGTVISIFRFKKVNK